MLKFVILCNFFGTSTLFSCFICACVHMKRLILNSVKWNWKRIKCDSFSGCYQTK